MTIPASLGHFSLPPKMRLIMSLKDLSKLFRMRRTAVFHPLNLTMAENFKMKSLTDSAVSQPGSRRGDQKLILKTISK